MPVWVRRTAVACCALFVALFLLTSSSAGVPPAPHEKLGGHDLIRVQQLTQEIPFENAEGGAWRQGWDIKVEPGRFTEEKPLRVIVMPHSHTDAGWRKTFAEYYRTETKPIITSVVRALAKDERRHFIWADIAFFEWWWREAGESDRKLARQAVERQQLEFVTAGWVMNDEANTNYWAMTEQNSLGQNFIYDTFGVTPEAGWAIDPFGYSPTQAYINKRSGLKYMLIQRAHYEIKKILSWHKNLEFWWRQAWDPIESVTHPESTAILTHLMPFYSYDIPHTCGPDPAVCCQFDFTRTNCPWRVNPKEITANNVAERAQTLLDQYKKKASLFRTRNVLIPLGDDFRYPSEAKCERQFTNYQRIFDYVNSHPELGATMEFGTLSTYFKAVEAESNGFADMTVIEGDFFTYADVRKDYWSGYYTSRPFYKELGRRIESLLRSTEIMYSLTTSLFRAVGSDDVVRVLSSLASEVDGGRRASAIFQHHDAVTGTARRHVVVDYGNMLNEAKVKLKGVLASAANALLNRELRALASKRESAAQAHASLGAGDAVFESDLLKGNQDDLPKPRVIDVTDTGRVVVVSNTLAEPRKEVHEVVVSDAAVEVVTLDGGRPVRAQAHPIWSTPKSPDSTANTFRLFFEVDVPALSLTSYVVRRCTAGGASRCANEGVTITVASERPGRDSAVGGMTVDHQAFGTDGFTIRNAFLEAAVDPKSGMLAAMSALGDAPVTAAVSEGLYAYTAKGGAYLFLPTGKAKAIHSPVASVVRRIDGPLVAEIESQDASYISTTYRLHKVDSEAGGRFLDAIHAQDGKPERNHEVVVRYDTDIKTNRVIYTDINSFQITRRPYIDAIPLEGNVYPLNSVAYLQDQRPDRGLARFSVITRQPMGVASLSDGSIEAVIDRRLTQDDARGLGEPVDDNLSQLHHLRLTLERATGEVTAGDVEAREAFEAVPLLSSATAAVVRAFNAELQATFAKPSPEAFLNTHFASYSACADLSLAADYASHIENLKVRDVEEDAALLLTLRTFRFDPLFGDAGAGGAAAAPSVDLVNLCAGLSLTSVQPTTLNALHAHTRALEDPPAFDVALHPFEMQAFLIGGAPGALDVHLSEMYIGGNGAVVGGGGAGGGGLPAIARRSHPPIVVDASDVDASLKELAARVEGNEADIAILGEELARLRAQVDAGAFGRGGKRLVAYGDDRMPSSGRDISALLYVAPVLLGIVPVGWILSQKFSTARTIKYIGGIIFFVVGVQMLLFIELR